MTTTKTRGKKLLHYLCLMSPKDRKAFKDWLGNQEKTKGPDWLACLDLFECCIAQNKTVQSEELTQLLIKGTQHKTASHNYLGVRLNQLLNKLLQFITINNFKKNEALHPLQLFDAVINANNLKYLNKTYQKALRSPFPNGSTQQFHNVLQVEVLMNQHLASHSTHSGVNHLDEVEEALDQYYILQKLKYGAARLTETLIGGLNKEIRFIDPVLDAVKAQYDGHPLLVQCYFHCYSMLAGWMDKKPEAEQHFYDFLALFQQTPLKILPEARDLFSYGQNFAVLQIRSGKVHFKELLANLYEEGFKSEIFEDHHSLSPLFLKNAIELFCKLNMMPTAEHVISTYLSRVRVNDSESIATYNKAVLDFFKRDYASVNSLLYQTIGSFEQIQYELGARTYLCRSLWETSQFEFLQDTLHAFTQFVFRNKVNLGQKARKYRFFIGFLRRMTIAKMELPSKQILLFRKIQRDFIKKSEANHFGWLRKKILAQFPDLEFVKGDDKSPPI